MTPEDLERYLERGNQLGFVKETDSPDYLGWILVSKQKPIERVSELFAAGENDALVREQEIIRERPYFVRVIELSREVHESDRYETNEDYRMNERQRFATLAEVDGFVRRLGHALEDIRWRADLDAP